MQQQGDVKLFQTLEDGEIEVLDGIVTMSEGLETSAFVAMFGGNEEDTGIKDDPLQWWGNLLENQPAEKIRSATQHVIRNLPSVARNLLKVREAVLSDLQYLIDEKIVNTLDVSVSIPEPKRLKIDVVSNLTEFTFYINLES